MNIRETLQKHGLRPRKGLSQHFLTSEAHLARIAQAAELTPADVVLEIGPGLGSLTQHLAAQAAQVVAVELDELLIPIARDLLADHSNVTIIQGDILHHQPSDILSRVENQAQCHLDTAVSVPGPYKVVANLPYAITSAVIRHLLEAKQPPQLLVLTVQREVGERICSAPPAMSLLAVSVQLYAHPELLFRIPPGAFYPQPKVDSAVVRLRLRPKPGAALEDPGRFFRIVRAGFGQRRKQLRNALAGGLHLPPEIVTAALNRAGIDPRRRAQTLTLTEWDRLHHALSTTALSRSQGMEPQEDER